MGSELPENRIQLIPSLTRQLVFARRCSFRKPYNQLRETHWLSLRPHHGRSRGRSQGRCGESGGGCRVRQGDRCNRDRGGRAVRIRRRTGFRPGPRRPSLPRLLDAIARSARERVHSLLRVGVPVRADMEVPPTCHGCVPFVSAISNLPLPTFFFGNGLFEPQLALGRPPARSVSQSACCEPSNAPGIAAALKGGRHVHDRTKIGKANPMNSATDGPATVPCIIVAPFLRHNVAPGCSDCSVAP
jgi:hypothetical protein